MKGMTAAIVAILVISLGIWTAFSLTSYPLNEQSTVVVVGVVGLVVFGVRAIVASVRKKRKPITTDGNRHG